jgi:hypothetical protein
MHGSNTQSGIQTIELLPSIPNDNGDKSNLADGGSDASGLVYRQKS